MTVSVSIIHSFRFLIDISFFCSKASIQLLQCEINNEFRKPLKILPERLLTNETFETGTRVGPKQCICIEGVETRKTSRCD